MDAETKEALREAGVAVVASMSKQANPLMELWDQIPEDARRTALTTGMGALLGGGAAGLAARGGPEGGTSPLTAAGLGALAGGGLGLGASALTGSLRLPGEPKAGSGPLNAILGGLTGAAGRNPIATAGLVGGLGLAARQGPRKAVMRRLIRAAPGGTMGAPRSLAEAMRRTEKSIDAMRNNHATHFADSFDVLKTKIRMQPPKTTEELIEAIQDHATDAFRNGIPQSAWARNSKGNIASDEAARFLDDITRLQGMGSRTHSNFQQTFTPQSDMAEALRELRRTGDAPHRAWFGAPILGAGLGVGVDDIVFGRN